MKNIRSKKSLSELLAEHPIYDLVPPILFVLAWRFAGSPLPDKCFEPDNFFIGIATLGGFVLTTATFVCTMMYQAGEVLMRVVRNHYGDVLARNWFSVLSWTLIASVVPLVLLYLRAYAYKTAFAIAVFTLVMITVKGIRSIFWLKYHFTMQIKSKDVKPDFTEKDWLEQHKSHSSTP